MKNNMRIFQEVNENMLCAALEDLIRERLEREVNIKVNEVVKEKISFDGCRMELVGKTCFILKRVTH